MAAPDPTALPAETTALRFESAELPSKIAALPADVTVRLARPHDDAAVCLSIYAPAIEGSAISFETEVPSVESFSERMRGVLAAHPWLVEERADGAIAGYAYASAHRSRAAYRFSVEVSAYVSSSFVRQGVARRLYARLFAVLRAQGFTNAYAGVALPNPASEGLHAALGFVPVGVYRRVGFKQGAWHDVAWSSLDLVSTEALPTTPAEPLATTALDPRQLASLLA